MLKHFSPVIIWYQSLSYRSHCKNINLYQSPELWGEGWPVRGHTAGGQDGMWTGIDLRSSHRARFTVLQPPPQNTLVKCHVGASGSLFSVPWQKKLRDYVRLTKWLLKLILVLEWLFQMRKLIRKEKWLARNIVAPLNDSAASGANPGRFLHWAFRPCTQATRTGAWN